MVFTNARIAALVCSERCGHAIVISAKPRSSGETVPALSDSPVDVSFCTFSALLVQAAVQAEESVSVSALLSTLTSDDSRVRNAEVGSSILLRSSCCSPLTAVVSGLFLLTPQALTSSAAWLGFFGLEVCLLSPVDRDLLARLS